MFFIQPFSPPNLVVLTYLEMDLALFSNCLKIVKMQSMIYIVNVFLFNALFGIYNLLKEKVKCKIRESGGFLFIEFFFNFLFLLLVINK